jgi:hypothetical protein
MNPRQLQRDVLPVAEVALRRLTVKLKVLLALGAAALLGLGVLEALEYWEIHAARAHSASPHHTP